MKAHDRTRRRRPLAATLAVAASLVLGGVQFATADVPTTPDPITYDKFLPIHDPGTSDPAYFQPSWFDTDGRHIQAHGGQVVVHEDEQGPVYYWYGEDRSNGYYDSPGVSAYSSRDGMNWTNEGVVLRSVTTRAELTGEYFDDVYDTVDENGVEDTELVDELFYNLNVNPTSPEGTDQLSAIFERPKVLYNEADDTWVMWWHADGKVVPGGSNYARSMAAVAVADSPNGPFKLVGAYRLYNRADYQACTQHAVPGQARDMTVFKDDDGTAWVVYSSEENATLYMARLDEHYTNVEKTTTVDTQGLQYSADGQYPYLFADGGEGAPVRGEDFQIVRECGHLESPAVFQFDGRYYVVTSGTTGWAPNQNTYYSADSLTGEWIRGVDPDDAYEHVSYSAIPEGGDGRISVGDTRQSTFGSQSTHVLPIDQEGGKFVYMGDRWNDGAADSNYVWLPITIGENGRLEMRNPATEDPERWGDGWDTSYWDDKGAGPHIWNVTDDGLPEAVDVGQTGWLPEIVEVTADGSTSEVAVEWDTSELTAPGIRTIRGTLAGDSEFAPGRTFTREIQVVDGLNYNIAPEAIVTASSRQDLAGTTNDLDLKAKGWDDWVSGGAYPLRSTLTYTWDQPRSVNAVTVHTYRDGTASWPSTIALQYRDAEGVWTDTGVSEQVEQAADIPAPTVALRLPETIETDGVRVVMETATSTWQAISEVEVFGLSDTADCGPVTAPWRSVAWGAVARTKFCQGADGSFRIGDNNGGAWTSSDALGVIGRVEVLGVGDAIVTTVADVDPGGNPDPRAGLVLRNSLAAGAKGSADGYALLVSTPTGVLMQYDADGNGYIDSETPRVATSAWPVQLKLELTDATTASGSWRASVDDEWQPVGTVPLADAQERLAAGVFASGNNNRGVATATFHDTGFLRAEQPGPEPTGTPTPEPTETPGPSQSPEPTSTPSGGPSTPAPQVTVTVTAAPVQPGDLYSTPGIHNSGGRSWHTTCEPYSQTIRCTTDIWATQVRVEDGEFVSSTGWVFNNLTYLPMMTRAAWASNPLGYAGEWTAADGRKWRTECDTAATGRGGCRSFAWADYVGSQQQADGTWRHSRTEGWIFNNIVRFKA